MSFWNTSDGDDTSTQGQEYDTGGGSMEPIPEGTDVLAALDESKWDNKSGANYISNRWTVLKPEAYKNRKVFQKLWVSDHNPSTQDPSKAVKQTDKAKRMLAAIDKNAGGMLTASGQMPTDETLASSLMNKPMVLKLGVWELTGDDGKEVNGNWVIAVSPASKGVAEVSKPAPKPQTGGGTSQEIDDEIPF